MHFSCVGIFVRYPSSFDYMVQELKNGVGKLQHATHAVPASMGPILSLLERLLPLTVAPVKTVPSHHPSLLLPSIQSLLVFIEH